MQSTKKAWFRRLAITVFQGYFFPKNIVYNFKKTPPAIFNFLIFTEAATRGVL